jgi:hypothetical protein
MSQATAPTCSVSPFYCLLHCCLLPLLQSLLQLEQQPLLQP